MASTSAGGAELRMSWYTKERPKLALSISLYSRINQLLLRPCFSPHLDVRHLTAAFSGDVSMSVNIRLSFSFCASSCLDLFTVMARLTPASDSEEYFQRFPASPLSQGLCPIMNGNTSRLLDDTDASAPEDALDVFNIGSEPQLYVHLQYLQVHAHADSQQVAQKSFPETDPPN